MSKTVFPIHRYSHPAGVAGYYAVVTPQKARAVTTLFLGANQRLPRPGYMLRVAHPVIGDFTIESRSGQYELSSTAKATLLAALA